MPRITDALDGIIKKRQAECDHSYQDRVNTPTGIYCGKCGKEQK